MEARVDSTDALSKNKQPKYFWLHWNLKDSQL